jgi:hypothetical protein
MLVNRLQKTKLLAHLATHSVTVVGGRIGKVVTRRAIVPSMKSVTTVPTKIGKTAIKQILAVY